MKQILIKPIISEKTMILVNQNKYTFEVFKNANKIEIHQEIKKIYQVNPLKVNIINIKSRTKHFAAKNAGKTRSWQKAIITLSKNEKIKDFEVKE